MQTEKKKIDIAIVDDHNLFRKGLIKLINIGDKENKYNILFEAENGNEMKDKISKKNIPDIILMDIDMPGMDGYESVGWLQNYHPGISILVVSMFESKESIVRMVRLGVHGYLSKDIEVEDMHAALEAISSKGFYYSDLASEIMASTIKNNDSFPELNDAGSNEIWKGLSQNERKFLELSCTDLTYREIAEKMNLSPKTIDGYRESLFDKCDVKSRVALAVFAIKNGLVKA
jgi:two-component system, NarL family, invasion response regulator UvrY